MAAETDLGVEKRGTGGSIIWGVLLIISGVLAIIMPLASSIGVAILLAWLIFLAGVWHLIFAFQTGRVGAFLWQVLLALVYGFAGVYMLFNPLLGVVSLTLLLAVFLLMEAVLEIALFFRLRRSRHAGWVLVDGIITLVLGFLIWMHWPASSVWVVGTLVGISLLFSGIARLMLALADRGEGAVSSARV